MARKNRYSAIIEAIFHGRYEAGDDSVEFHRDQITAAALSLGIAPPSNLGDVIYTFRYRQSLPTSIRATAPKGKTWIIRAAGRARYRFDLVKDMIWLVISAESRLGQIEAEGLDPGLRPQGSQTDQQLKLRVAGPPPHPVNLVMSPDQVP